MCSSMCMCSCCKRTPYHNIIIIIQPYILYYKRQNTYASSYIMHYAYISALVLIKNNNIIIYYVVFSNPPGEWKQRDKKTKNASKHRAARFCNNIMPVPFPREEITVFGSHTRCVCST